MSAAQVDEIHKVSLAVSTNDCEWLVDLLWRDDVDATVNKRIQMFCCNAAYDDHLECLKVLIGYAKHANLVLNLRAVYDHMLMNGKRCVEGQQRKKDTQLFLRRLIWPLSSEAALRQERCARELAAASEAATAEANPHGKEEKEEE